MPNVLVEALLSRFSGLVVIIVCAMIERLSCVFPVSLGQSFSVVCCTGSYVSEMLSTVGLVAKSAFHRLFNLLVAGVFDVFVRIYLL